MTSDQMHERIIDSFSSSFWLQKAVEEMSLRDPVDALADAETLLEFCKLQWAEAQGLNHEN